MTEIRKRTTPPAPNAIDLHVHIAGVGANGAGCWFSPERLSAPGFRLLLRSLGLGRKEAEKRLDPILRDRLFAALERAPALGQAVVLAFDYARDERGAPLPGASDFYVPNEYVLGLAEAHGKILPGLSIHPYRPDALEELTRGAKSGGVLVKWLPTSQRFDPRDERCAPFYERCGELGLPLLIHTGSEGATRNHDKALNDPRVLLPALEAGLTVVAAHSALRSAPHDRDHFETWQAMLKDYPNLYGDSAAMFGLRARRFLKVLGREGVADRLVHGSDWPVPNSPWWFFGALGWRKMRTLAKIPSPLERDLQTKRALGLPETVFTRGRNLLRRPEA